MRRPGVRILGFALILACLAPLLADVFPHKPMELTVLFGAGSAADLLLRTLAELAGNDPGQPVASIARALAAPSATRRA
jgi:tripartite-type tricarboxylate transporter receptor subunit TctC